MITGTSGRSLGQKLKTAHPRHVDVGEDQDERYARRVADALKCGRAGLGELHGELASAEVPPFPPKALAKQHLDVRFVIDHENEGLMLDFGANAAARGRIILNSVNLAHVFDGAPRRVRSQY